jgi:hypothetical protein
MRRFRKHDTRLSAPDLLMSKGVSYESSPQWLAQWLTIYIAGCIDRLNLISSKACFTHKPRGTGQASTESLCVQYLHGV